MTVHDWQHHDKAVADRREPLARRSASLRSRLVNWLRLFVLRRRINAMLRQSVGPVRREDVATLPPHLLRDIGLQPPM
jgi:hypothetical protein